MKLLRRQREGLEVMESILWESAVTFLDNGADPADVAEAMGVSRATLYRRVSQLREQKPDPLA